MRHTDWKLGPKTHNVVKGNSKSFLKKCFLIRLYHSLGRFKKPFPSLPFIFNAFHYFAVALAATPYYIPAAIGWELALITLMFLDFGAQIGTNIFLIDASHKPFSKIYVNVELDQSKQRRRRMIK